MVLCRSGELVCVPVFLVASRTLTGSNPRGSVSIWHVKVLGKWGNNTHINNRIQKITTSSIKPARPISLILTGMLVRTFFSIRTFYHPGARIISSGSIQFFQ